MVPNFSRMHQVLDRIDEIVRKCNPHMETPKHSSTVENRFVEILEAEKKNKEDADKTKTDVSKAAVLKAIIQEAEPPQAVAPITIEPQAAAPIAIIQQAATPKAIVPQAAAPKAIIQQAAAPKTIVQQAAAPKAIAPQVAVSKAAASVDDLRRKVSRVADEYNIDEELIRAVIQVESGWKRDAVSSKGAMGLMQLMPRTAAMLGVDDAFDPEQNIEGGVKYLAQLTDKYQGDVEKALAAYNAGPSRVDAAGGKPPFQATARYVQNVMALYHRYREE